MTHFGKIRSYDSSKGTGTISPEKGGDVLPFRKSDLQQEAQDPQQHDRYGYEVKNADNGRRYAINLAPQQGEPDVQKDQADAQQG